MPIETLYLGGRVFDGERPPVAGHGVLVQGGHIARVAPAPAFAGFAGKVVDTAGGTLLPGLVDCHVHVSFGAEPDPDGALAALDQPTLVAQVRARVKATLAGGVTAIRDCGGDMAAMLTVRDEMKAAIGAGPTIQACGPIICRHAGDAGRVGRVAEGTAGMAVTVDDLVAAGCDFINIMATGARPSGPDTSRWSADAHDYSEAELTAAIAAAKAAGRRIASNAQTARDILVVAREGADSVEQGSQLSDAALAEMLAHDVVLVPSLLARHNMQAARRRAGRTDERHDALAAETWQSLRRFYDAGGRIAMGTDCGAPGSRHGDNAQELALLVAAGMAPLAALRAGTRAGADLMGLAEAGRIADGAAADFLIVAGNPADDIAMVADRANHRLVVKDGCPVTV